MNRALKGKPSFSSTIRTPKQRAYATPMVTSTAQEMCAAIYEELAKDNKFYAQWPSQDVFVSKFSHQYLEEARQALIKILAGDYPESMKQPIYEDLLLDKGLAEAGERGTIN